MKENTTKNKKTAFKKILNYLLFQNFNTPTFSSEYTTLSKSFIESNKVGSITDEAFNLKLNDIFKIQLLNLDFEDRGEIITTILNDQKSYNVLLFFYAMEIEKQFKNKPADIHAEFLKMLLYYQSDNQLNVFLIILFKHYFIELYEFQFSKPSYISKDEYLKIQKLFI